MKRDYAEAIVAGRKTVEFRDYIEHYGNRLLDKDVMRWREKNDTRLTDQDLMYANPIREVRMIHFYDYNGSWALDVAVKETGLVSIVYEDVKMLQERFSCHEQDHNLATLNSQNVPESERPVLFYFAIDGILSSSL